MLEIGTKAPAFSLPDQNGDMHTLEDYKGKRSFCISIRKTARAGCTKQACGFAELYPRIYGKRCGDSGCQ